MVRLDPANAAYDPQVYAPGEVQVQGTGGVAGTAQVDEVGWFSLPVPTGMFRLQVRTTDGRGTSERS